MLGGLLLALAGGFAAVAACVALYVGSTPPHTLEVPRGELAVGVPQFTPLPMLGAAGTQTHGVWLTLQADGSALALSSREPLRGCFAAWRADVTFEQTTGVYRDGCGGATYARDGTALGGPAPRDLDRYEARVDAQRVVVELERVRLGACRAAATECSRPGAPAYRRTAPTPVATAGR